MNRMGSLLRMSILASCIGFAGLAQAQAQPQPPANAPKGSTGVCKDGSFYSGAEKQGACRGHKGVDKWWGPTSAAPVTPATPAAPAKAPEKSVNATPAPAAPPSKMSPAPAPAPSPSATAPKPQPMPTTPAAPRSGGGAAAGGAAATGSAASTGGAAAGAGQSHERKLPPNPETLTAAPGGGNGKVWFNESTKVYHCQGDRWYGKTKEGAYMSEDQAKSQGGHGPRGKGCS